MNSGKTIFAQLMDFIPSAYEFRCCVERYHGHYKVKSFSCWDQFLTLAFAHLRIERVSETSKRVCEQLRKSFIIWVCAALFRQHLGQRQSGSRIYADFAHTLIQEARSL